jgi:uncharacterized cupredoxin-like copper-binding protein
VQRARLTLVLAGLAAWLFGFAAGPAAGQVKAAKVTVITVTLGKPTELGIKLSKVSAVPAGTVTFKVTNQGKITHNFKLCTSAVTSSKANSCAGKVTKALEPGASATLTVTLKKTGKYEFLCTIPGHAGAGMKGLLGIGVQLTATPAPVAVAGGAAGGASGATCNNPQSTTVTVDEFDYGFTLSQNSVPCGPITFIQTNSGNRTHNFDVNGSAGAWIEAGETTRMTVTFKPGTYRYMCDEFGHEYLGMIGTLTVT